MERKNFKPPEVHGSSEDDDSNETDEKENTTSTRSSERHTGKSEDQQGGLHERWAEGPRSLWRRVTQELVTNDEPTSEAVVPEEPAAEDPTKKIITEFAANLEEGSGSGEVPLGHLDTTEQHEAAKAYIELRQQEIEDELKNLEPDTVESKAATIAEHLLEATQQELDGNPTAEIEAVTEQAYRNTLRTDLPETLETIAARALTDTEATAIIPVATTERGDALPEQFTHYLEDDNQDVRFPAPETQDGNSGDGSRNQEFRFGGFEYNAAPFRRRQLRDTASRTATTVENAQARRQTAAVGVLAGVVGYLIGRRSGRIKTEKRLMTIQKKLEAEVRTTYARLQEKEAQIRQVAYTHLAPPPAERAVQPPKIKTAETAPILTSTLRQEAQPVNSSKPTEHLGRTTLKALEAHPAEGSKPRNIETISQHELIEMSEHIAVGATNLRKVYETNLVSERGLRRIVGEYRRGGDVRRALAEEMLAKELSYERDPMLRDKQLNAAEQAAGGGRQSGTRSAPDVSPEKEAIVPQTTYPAPQTGTTKPGAKPKTQPALVMANVAALAILAILVIVLFVVWIQKLI